MLEAFLIKCLQQIIGLTWEEDKVPHTEILRLSGLTSIEVCNISRQLKWLGHVICIPGNQLPRIILYGELQDGHKLLGGLKKRYRNHLKKTLKVCGIPFQQLETLASVSVSWRQVVSDGVNFFKTEREPV